MISSVNQIDPLLMRAAESTGQRGLYESFVRVFADAGEVCCWVNPGEVKVLRGRSLSVVYSDGKGSDNPYEKLRVKVLMKYAHVFETLCAPSMTQARALRTAHRRARRPLRRGAPPQPMRRARTSADDAAPCVLRRNYSARTR